jgi:hypothetical protein
MVLAFHDISLYLHVSAHSLAITIGGKLKLVLLFRALPGETPVLWRK